MTQKELNCNNIAPFNTLSLDNLDDVPYQIGLDLGDKINVCEKKDKSGFIQEIGTVGFYELLFRHFKMKSTINTKYFDSCEAYDIDDDERNLIIEKISSTINQDEATVKLMFGKGEFPFFTVYKLKTKLGQIIICYDFCR